MSISGIGTLAKNKAGNNILSVSEMFNLTPHSIIDYWKHYSEQAKFTVLKSDDRFEFLKTKPSFGNGYWIEKPDINTGISLMRTSALGTRIYYFYKYNNNEVEASQIPYWLTEDMNYLYLSNGLLASKEVLPDIKYQEKVMDELSDKNKLTIQNPIDDEFERKLQELQNKRKNRNE